ncbi:MAG TPA: hypothetical protein VNZ06_11855 [Steroidobacteraceae bacterium]|jgi:hypothetical protein|nr:hypothetical protein [Steroidobacteraceae bacterium]
MRVRLIGKANGVGLSRDISLLGAALRDSGCQVEELPCNRRERKRRRSIFTQWKARIARARPHASRARCEVNIMLEHAWPQFLHEAALNVLVPNPEWFDRRDAALLARFDRIWAKTTATERIFAAQGCRVVQIGFDSEDRMTAGVQRQPRFLHLAGRSELKGTTRLLEQWHRHPEWPALTVIQDEAAVTTAHRVTAGNVLLQTSFLDDAQLRTLQNSHRFHLCLSEAEGWGHYIAEALSVGAVTLTCDAAPMNELVTAERGLLLAAPLAGMHNLSRVALFEPAALAAAVTQSQTMPAEHLNALGQAARQWFLDNKRDFPARVRRAMGDLETELRRVRA